MKDKIVIKGARENNLKGIDVTIPRDKFVVFTGVSGSGKSSLAFDTIYAEGQRRYIESLSSYARQFLGQMEKPDVELIEGLSPAISIDQKSTNKNPRSTVGTVTEIYDYLRLLYARIGIAHCPNCGKVIKHQSLDQILDIILSYPESEKIQIISPVVRGQKGTHQKVFSDALKKGFLRVRVNGEIYRLDEEIPELDKNKKHTIGIIVDRLKIKGGLRERLSDTLETALGTGEGLVEVLREDGSVETFSEHFACHDCGINVEELSPRAFSFNNPYGACPKCSGLGTYLEVDPFKLIKDAKKSINQGGISASGWNFTDKESIAFAQIKGLSEHYGFSLDTPIEKLPKKYLDKILYGTGNAKIDVTYERSYGKGSYKVAFEGIINNLERRYRETSSEWIRMEIETCMSQSVCPECHGERLRPEILAVTVGDKNISDLTKLSVVNAIDFFQKLKLTEQENFIAEQILKEINARLNFLKNVGLDYLTLHRSASTLSGGEAQRIRLATQIGSGLVGVLYILDEPSIGLHQRDNEKLLAALKNLRDIGNTLIVVEHDEDTIREADFVVDVGPGAGIYGGEIVTTGTPEDIMNCKESVTGDYLSGRKFIPIPEVRRKGNGRSIKIIGATQNNLKNIDVEIPLGKMVGITGVSGSGKSSLINEILYKSLSVQLDRSKRKPGLHKKILGVENIDKVININQFPIGKTPRSNPATYTGVFGDIRDLYASTNQAKVHGYTASRFSFNVKGGRCEACSGDGIIKIEMHFLPDVYVPCEVCKGKRYNAETLEVTYKGKNIYDVLEMSVAEGVEFFDNIPKIKNKLKTLCDVGLGYIKIGHPSTLLSGGEAQRVKLATELQRKHTGNTLYILDEPTTGLHTADVHRLINVLNTLIDAGNTVVVIEHNLDIIKCCDHIIDLGPEGGDGGGTIVAEGSPEEVMLCKKSYTGQFLKKILKK